MLPQEVEKDGGQEYQQISTHHLSIYTYIHIHIDIHCFRVSNSLRPQAFLSMGFSRPEYWNGLPFPIPGYVYISFPCDSCYIYIYIYIYSAMSMICDSTLLARIGLLIFCPPSYSCVCVCVCASVFCTLFLRSFPALLPCFFQGHFL